MFVLALYIMGMIGLLAYGIYDSARSGEMFPEWTKDPICPRCGFKLWISRVKDAEEMTEPWRCEICGFQDLPQRNYLLRLVGMGRRVATPAKPAGHFEDFVDGDGITPLQRLIRGENGNE